MLDWGRIECEKSGEIGRNREKFGSDLPLANLLETSRAKADSISAPSKNTHARAHTHKAGRASSPASQSGEHKRTETRAVGEESIHLGSFSVAKNRTHLHRPLRSSDRPLNTSEFIALASALHKLEQKLHSLAHSVITFERMLASETNDRDSARTTSRSNLESFRSLGQRERAAASDGWTGGCVRLMARVGPSAAHLATSVAAAAIVEAIEG